MENNNTPEIRFPGYRGDWEERKIGEFLTESRISGTNGLKAKKLTVKLWGKGVVPKEEIYQGSEETKYYIRKAGQFIYGKLDFLHQAFGIIPNNLDGYESTLDSPAFDIAENLNSYFFLEYVSRKQFYLYQGTIANGSRKAKRIHSDTFFNMPLIMPSVEEQTDIGTFFKKIDDTIALHQQELTTLKQTKQGFFQKMFPKEGESIPEVRFPGFTGEWEERKVKDFSEETFGGGTPKTSIKEYWNGEIPWIQSSDLEEHQVSSIFAKKKITEKGLQNSATKLIPKNSIAIVTRVGVGKIALIQFEYATSQDFLSLSNLKVNEWFGVYSLYNQLQKELHNVQGTSIKGITKNELLEKKINIPTDLKEQIKIGNFFKKLDNTIALHQRELDALKETKKAFLQKMFV
ncbi:MULTISPECIES: restriction endonuclease subunit S [Bacillus]|uniref:restriction endonuclease subunit S n=1 Tax=Bacillus TaxID=1386 RepID=UPI0011A6E8B4|nr:restriction endonuclease subunit S [Bacillus paralicheniformis]TWK34993.1 hypothetical protein CHCC20348_3090 [Bacillus paralicheniformis]